MSKEFPTDKESSERIPSQEELDIYASMEKTIVARDLAKMNLNPSIDRQPVINEWMRVYSEAFQIAFSNLVEGDSDFLRRCQTSLDNTDAFMDVLKEIETEFDKIKKSEGLPNIEGFEEFE